MKRKTESAKAGTRQEPESEKSLKKTYLKSRNACKVTFRLAWEAAYDAKQVCIVGEFNDWNPTATRMKKLKSGEFSVTLELEPGREYQYRYLIDNTRWENDWGADRYEVSPFGDCENSVVIV